MRPSVVDVGTAWHRSAADLAAGARSALSDLDNALSIRPELRLSTWESAAMSHAHDPADGPILRDNVRRIVSVWSTVDRLSLTDYSARLWNGLVGGLYRERWRVWLEELMAARNGGGQPDETALTRRIDDLYSLDR